MVGKGRGNEVGGVEFKNSAQQVLNVANLRTGSAIQWERVRGRKAGVESL